MAGWIPQTSLPQKRNVGDKIPPGNDLALVIDRLEEMAKAGLLDTTSAKQTFVQTPTPLTLVASDTDPNLQSPDQLWVQTGGAAIVDSGFFADRATSTCQTCPPFLIATTLTLTNGGLNAALAVNKETKAYTQIRFLLTGWTTAPTDLYAVIWGLDGSVLGSTDTLVAQATAGGVLITGTLKTPVPISAGTRVYLGVVCIGGSGLSIARATFAGAVAGYAQIQALAPLPIAVSMTGQTGVPSSGTPPTLLFTTRTSNVPWIELV